MKEETDELERGFEALISELRIQMEESSKNALTKPSLRDLPFQLFSSLPGSLISSHRPRLSPLTPSWPNSTTGIVQEEETAS